MSDSNRLEREIEEILGKIEQFPDAGARRRRSTNRALQRVGTAVSDRVRGFARQLSRFSISQVMLLSFILIIASLFFRRAAPGVMTWVLYAGIILFVTAFAISIFGRGGSSSTPRWRGRTVQYQASPSLAQRLRFWWNSRIRR
ncbi:MAG: hypothetical protein AB7G21_12800 [Dehalococcoidia bacterium]